VFLVDTVSTSTSTSTSTHHIIADLSAKLVESLSFSLATGEERIKSSVLGRKESGLTYWRKESNSAYCPRRINLSLSLAKRTYHTERKIDLSTTIKRFDDPGKVISSSTSFNNGVLLYIHFVSHISLTFGTPLLPPAPPSSRRRGEKEG